MLVASAVCPCPPLLVPALAGAAAPELAELRAACAGALAVLAAARPDQLVVAGTGGDPQRSTPYPPGRRGRISRGSGRRAGP